MIASSPAEPKPERLYFESYLQMLHNSVGTEMFRNFYIRLPDGTTKDALEDGNASCAAYVSSVLTILGKLKGGFHGTVSAIEEDLQKSGWQQVQAPKAGDVIVWEAMEFPDGTYEHIGFALSSSQAVSTSWTEKKVVKHDMHFGDTQRPIRCTYRSAEWDIDRSS